MISAYGNLTNTRSEAIRRATYSTYQGPQDQSLLPRIVTGHSSSYSINWSPSGGWLVMNLKLDARL